MRSPSAHPGERRRDLRPHDIIDWGGHWEPGGRAAHRGGRMLDILNVLSFFFAFLLVIIFIFIFSRRFSKMVVSRTAIYISAQRIPPVLVLGGLMMAWTQGPSALQRDELLSSDRKSVV